MANRTCSVDGCEKPQHAHGWCGMHYQRWRRLGDPLSNVKTYRRVWGLSAEDRFWFHVTKTADCWLWTGTVDGAGYGKIVVDQKRISAHRYSWQLSHGAIPDGLWVLHHCDTPPCVRPDHLFLGTQTDNMADKASKGRDWNQRKTHCKHGHPFDDVNTGIARGTGRRYCRACHRQQGRRWYREHS